MAKPTEIREWATSRTALKTEPGDGQKRTGFTIEQPSVNVLNWVLNNIYRWIDFFNEGGTGTGGGGGYLYHEHNTSRIRVEIPFTLPASNKLAALEVLQRMNVSVGGVSSTAYSGTGAVTAASEGTADSFSFTSSFDLSPAVSWVQSYESIDFKDYRLNLGSSGPAIQQRINNNFTNVVTANSPTGQDKYVNLLNLSVISIFLSNGHLNGLAFVDDEDVGPYQGNTEMQGLFRMIGGNSSATGLYMIVYSSSDRNNYFIYNIRQGDFTQSMRRTGERTYNMRSGSTTSIPVESSGNVSRALNRVQFAGAYSVGGGSGGSGSQLSAAVALDNTAPFGLAAYQYNPTAKTIVVTLSGTSSATAFHTLVIRQNNQDVTSLLASAAAYNTGDKTFTWSSISTDPLSAGGSYLFVFQTAGGGLAAYNFVAITTGLSVETYSNKNYLTIGAGANVSNGTPLLIRRV